MSLLAKYNFDSTDYNTTSIADHSGNDNDLSKSGTGGSWETDDPFSEPGIYSFLFNTNQHFEKVLEGGEYTGDFSISFWFKPSSSTMSNNESIVAFHNNNSQDTFQIGTPNGGNSIYVQCKNESGKKFLIGNYTSYVGDGSGEDWTHLGVTFNNSSSTLKTYMNGSLTGTHSPSSLLDFDINCIKVGSNRNGGSRFDGYITLLRLYDEELSSGAIGTLHSANEHCYHPNTNILTNKGYVNITKLMRGDLIKTLNGFKPLSKLVKNINVNNKFIKFEKDSIDKNIPNEDLMITSGHPVYFKDDYYLPENFLILDGVTEVIDYNSCYVYHLVFDTHEVIYSNSLTTTSLPPTTSCDNMALTEDEYYDKKNYVKENVGKMYPPYILHENPIFMKKL
jgi:hypothetical protein